MAAYVNRHQHDLTERRILNDWAVTHAKLQSRKEKDRKKSLTLYGKKTSRRHTAQQPPCTPPTQNRASADPNEAEEDEAYEEERAESIQMMQRAQGHIKALINSGDYDNAIGLYRDVREVCDDLFTGPDHEDVVVKCMEKLTDTEAELLSCQTNVASLEEQLQHLEDAHKQALSSHEAAIEEDARRFKEAKEGIQDAYDEKLAQVRAFYQSAVRGQKVDNTQASERQLQEFEAKKRALEPQQEKQLVALRVEQEQALEHVRKEMEANLAKEKSSYRSSSMHPRQSKSLSSNVRFGTLDLHSDGSNGRRRWEAQRTPRRTSRNVIADHGNTTQMTGHEVFPGLEDTSPWSRAESRYSAARRGPSKTPTPVIMDYGNIIQLGGYEMSSSLDDSGPWNGSGTRHSQTDSNSNGVEPETQTPLPGTIQREPKVYSRAAAKSTATWRDAKPDPAVSFEDDSEMEVESTSPGSAVIRTPPSQRLTALDLPPLQSLNEILRAAPDYQHPSPIRVMAINDERKVYLVKDGLVPEALRGLIDKLERRLKREVASHPRAKSKRLSWEDFGKTTKSCIHQYCKNLQTARTSANPAFSTCRICFNRQLPCVRYFHNKTLECFAVVPLPEELRVGVAPDDINYYIYPEAEAQRGLEKGRAKIWVAPR